MKNQALLILLASGLLVTSGCAVLKGIVRDITKAVDAAIDVPVGAVTNTVNTLHPVVKAPAQTP